MPRVDWMYTSPARPKMSTHGDSKSVTRIWFSPRSICTCVNTSLWSSEHRRNLLNSFCNRGHVWHHSERHTNYSSSVEFLHETCPPLQSILSSQHQQLIDLWRNSPIQTWLIGSFPCIDHFVPKNQWCSFQGCNGFSSRSFHKAWFDLLDDPMNQQPKTHKFKSAQQPKSIRSRVPPMKRWCRIIAGRHTRYVVCVPKTSQSEIRPSF